MHSCMPPAPQVLKGSKYTGSNRVNGTIPYQPFHVIIDDFPDQVLQAQDKIEYESDAQ